MYICTDIRTNNPIMWKTFFNSLLAFISAKGISVVPCESLCALLLPKTKKKIILKAIKKQVEWTPTAFLCLMWFKFFYNRIFGDFFPPFSFQNAQHLIFRLHRSIIKKYSFHMHENAFFYCYIALRYSIITFFKFFLRKPVS